jgi:hypothetical protein
MFKKILVYGGLALLILFILIQFLPIGRDHTNPPIVQEPNWDSPQTRELAKRACFDCHSNETTWPWYSNIAPVSWILEQHVTDGRKHLNFSDWGERRVREPEELAEVILEGEMPLRPYLPLHPEARLTADEKQALAQGLLNTAR